MICYGNYLKSKDTDPETGINEIKIDEVFGKGNVYGLGARYTDRFLILDREDFDSEDSEDKN